ncbi:hypothetical protein LEP1GSC041_0333 [Leptospira noguchii str. 2006001870]|uniref:Uncharacterized protein n=1 Tax=Leptospira noguchii serovar Autumnalis str. ZUN142 TaxID=1085540 RepID=M6UIP2_9LEPT|nr:hypothetical protein LEP1GSC041_0333 [Leptospira noguchii str. 2006001870]EMO26293.1 hypothetical protein LEP1GSC170_5944 [Leptospira interrogans serovar Bataviae str. HAI135]EMO40934.1 hypothetical protein LEP1GSC186_3173 [Leptospira noguchii serovar Autumnalis str. ZUN142]
MQLEFPPEKLKQGATFSRKIVVFPTDLSSDPSNRGIWL